MKKVLGIILGVLICVGGFYCILMPTITFSSLTIILAITIIERAIAYFVIWLQTKKKGNSHPLLLVNAILSIICGIGLFTDFFTQLIVEGMMLNMIATFMIISGIIDIVDLFKNKKQLPGGLWIISLIMSIMLIFSGIFSIINPLILEITIGTIMAVNIFTFGISLIVKSILFKEVQ